MHRSLAVIALVAMASFVCPLLAQNPVAPRPAPASPAAPPTPATRPAGRTPEQIQQELRELSQQLQQAVGDPQAVFDADKRKEIAPKALPIMKKMAGLLEELGAVMTDSKDELYQARLEFLAISIAMGDADSAAALKTLAQQTGQPGLEAQCAQQLAAWWVSSKDEAAQNRILDQMQKMAKENPKSETIAQAVVKMSEMGPANPALVDRAHKIVAEDLTSDFAKEHTLKDLCDKLAADWQKAKDEGAQNKLLDEVQKIAKANPKSDTVAQMVARIAQAATIDAVADRAQKILDTDLAGEFAKEVGIQVRCGRLVGQWRAKKDEAAQNKILDDVQNLAKADPKNEIYAKCLGALAETGAASDAVIQRVVKILNEDLKSDLAKQIAGQVQGERKMRESVGKPVEFKSTTIDANVFSTKEWKGKVILVDFWATWCEPCMKELPRVKKAYIQWHAKGLEILGVSCDEDANVLKDFLRKNKDMPWPQFFDPKENLKERWHPIAREWGVTSIPTMFLIDRKGILRNVDAGEKFEEEIPKLLEEK